MVHADAKDIVCVVLVVRGNMLLERCIGRVSGRLALLASSLESRFVKITGNGVMDVVVNVSDELKGNVCGAGSVRYLGTPDVFVTACAGVSVSAG